MQTHAARVVPIRVNLHEETDGLEAMHRSWTQQVSAWRLAHDIAVESAESILRRTDALIAKLEAR
jgi:hypothetical protein